MVEKLVRPTPIIERMETRQTNIEDFDIWDEVTKKINHSDTNRIPWKLFLGDSLTAVILRYKKSGLNSRETYFKILDHAVLKKVVENFSHKSEEIKDKLKISVCARYGENNTAMKILNEDKE